MPDYDDYDHETKIAVAQLDIAHIKEELDELDKKISAHYVTDVEYDPIKQIVYGLVSLILIAVVGALLALVVQ